MSHNAEPDVERTAYTLLCSVEPALIRAVRDAPNTVALQLNNRLLDEVRGWTHRYRIRRGEEEGVASILSAEHARLTEAESASSD